MNEHYSNFINANFGPDDVETLTAQEMEEERAQALDRWQREQEEERDALHPVYNWAE